MARRVPELPLFQGRPNTGRKFKVPFSLDQLTGEVDQDFVYRSRLGELLAPGRDIGVMVHGSVLHRALGYEGGVFRHDGDNATFGDNPGAGRTIAGRVTSMPLRPFAKDSPLAELTLGFAMTGGDVPEGLNALRGLGIWDTLFSSDVYVKGQRLRLGVEESWEPGPFSVKSEYMRVSDERLGQGLLDVDLPSLVWQGWYVAGAWVVTGRREPAASTRAVRSSRAASAPSRRRAATTISKPAATRRASRPRRTRARSTSRATARGSGRSASTGMSTDG